MENEIIFSEPLIEAHEQKKLLKDLDNRLANFIADKSKAELLLNGPNLSNQDKEKLEGLVQSCEQIIAEIGLNQIKTNAEISKLEDEHHRLKDILENFKPTDKDWN